ncbi:MAG: serine hydrolase, partial [Clostridia bacterium]
MKKSIKILILVAIIAVIAILPTSVFAISTMDIKSKSALLMSENGEVVFEYNGTKKLPIASMTKIMTLVCVYDAINNKKLSLEDSVTVSENAASMGGSQVFLS